MSEGQRLWLEQLIRRRSTPQYLTKRARIVLESVEGISNSEISRRLPLDCPQVTLWRERWVCQYPRLCLIEHEHPEELEAAVIQVLRDEPRPGIPPTFTEQQVVQIVAIAVKFRRPGEGLIEYRTSITGAKLVVLYHIEGNP
ncbi:hypothetical protein ACFQY3_25300 [Paenibacillus farraposensis]|uniref:hypothetical protein n=1 Tax=Paenibacillus farraposensis TaxID=2807095 RepID=UPI003615B456